MRLGWVVVGALASGCWQGNPYFEAGEGGASSTSSASSTGEASTSTTGTSTDASGSAGESSTTGVMCGPPPEAPAAVWMVVDEVNDMVNVRSLLRLDAAERRAMARFSMNDAGSSRVVVNAFGDAATVGGGDTVVVFAADASRCPEVAASSASPTDVRPWLGDGCMRWSAQGPVGAFMVAWEGLDADGCPAASPGLWVAGKDPNDAAAPAVFSRFIEGVQIESMVVEWPVGIPYLASVDRQGRLWATGSLVDGAVSTAVMIRPDLTSVDITPPAQTYGQTLDDEGILWAAGPAGIYRLDTNAVEGTWAWETALDRPDLHGWGVTFADGRLWVGQGDVDAFGSCGVVTYEPGAMAEMPGTIECVRPKGVAIDTYGMLWVADTGGLLRVYDAQSFTAILLADMPPGTVVPQTYSDFTGLALRRALGL